MRLGDIRAHFGRLGATVRVTAWWNGAALDRLLDERHARVVEAATRQLRRFKWTMIATETSFSEYGERGSIDLFGGQPEARAVFVGEAKSEWGSIEETLRRLNVKARLAPKIAEQTFGFRPRYVAAALVFPDETTHRRITARFPDTIGAALPSRGRDIRAWLRHPAGSLRGIWFLSNVGDDRPGISPARAKAASKPDSPAAGRAAADR